MSKSLNNNTPSAVIKKDTFITFSQRNLILYHDNDKIGPHYYMKLIQNEYFN